MPKKAKELSAVQVRRLQKRGHHSVGGVSGLLLQISESGARSWVLRITIGGRRRDIGLGGFPDVPLVQARERARDAREQVQQGIDPVEARRSAQNLLNAEAAKRVTFNECARRLIANKAREFKNAKHTAQWDNTLKTYASPIIGRLPVHHIELAHILQVLEPIWATKTETATRLRGRIESVLSYATASGFRHGDNPARWRGNLDAILPKPRKLVKVNHHRALPYEQMPSFMVHLRRREGMSALALEFLILTATRSGEVRGATWPEIDLEAKTWTIPSERMKSARPHVVPLSPTAIKLLKSVPRMDDSIYVFPAPRGGMLSDMSLSAVTRRMDVDAVPHGFRSTFRDWAAERTNYANEVCEMALAHVIGNKTEAAYRRGDLLVKRARLMSDWAKFINTELQPGQVIKMAGMA